jgi:ELWxxDGT repeat protein
METLKGTFKGIIIVFIIVLPLISDAQEYSLVDDINKSNNNKESSSYPKNLTEFMGKIYFAANAGNSNGLWAIDTSNTIELVMDGFEFNGGEDNGDLTNLIVFNNKLYFSAGTPEIGRELWVYDGINSPYVEYEVAKGDTNSDVKNLFIIKDTLYFVAFDFKHGNYGLWKYDGKNAPQYVTNMAIHPNDFCVFKDTLYYTANPSYYDPEEVYYYDWKNAPKKLNDKFPGSNCKDAGYLTLFGDKLYFNAKTANYGYELMVYDGINPPDTVSDLNPGSAHGGAGFLAVFNGKLYFTANNGINGYEPMVFDGVNPPDTLADIIIGSAGSYPSNYFVFKNKLYFRASNGSTGDELYVME